MNTNEFSKFLKSNRACKESYSETEGRSLEEWVRYTQRADWLIWLWVKINRPEKYSELHKQLLKATVYCAKSVKQTKESLQRLDVFLAFASGEATQEEFAAAATDAAAAYATAYDTPYAAAAAADATYATDAAAADAATDAKSLSHLSKLTPRVREILFPEFANH